jgi:predicted small secreted protein
MKNLFLIITLIACCFALSGCGETISGIGKDISRMGKGVQTIFVRDSGEEY